MHTVVLSSCVFVAAVLLLTVVTKAESNPLPSREDLINSVDDDGEVRIRNPYFFDLLANIEQELLARREMLEKILQEDPRHTLERRYLGNINRGLATDTIYKYRKNLFNKG